MARNTMSVKRAEGLAKKLTRKHVTAYMGPSRAASLLNDKKLFTASAYLKIQKAFLLRVMKSKKYPAIEKMYAESKLRELRKRK